MRRSRVFIAVLVVVALTVALGGCAPASDGEEPAGDLHVAVPDLRGFSQTDAQDILTDSGFALGEVTEAPAEGAAPGSVISQDPIPGTALARYGKVDIVIASE